MSCNTSREVSDFLSQKFCYKKLNNRQHTVIYEQLRSCVLEDHSHSS